MLGNSFLASLCSIGTRLVLNDSRRVLNRNLSNYVNPSVTSTRFKSENTMVIPTVSVLPEKPKRPLTPYFRYMKERRLQLKTQHPDWEPKELIRKVAEDWRSVDESIKEKYSNQYLAERDNYHKTYSAYSDSLTKEQREEIKELNTQKRNMRKRRVLKKELKDLNKPKRPIGPFMLYLMDEATHTDLKYNKLMVNLKGSWATLDENKKSHYTQKYKVSYEKYLKDLWAWEQQMIKDGRNDLVRAKTLEIKKPQTWLLKNQIKRKIGPSGDETVHNIHTSSHKDQISESSSNQSMLENIKNVFLSKATKDGQSEKSYGTDSSTSRTDESEYKK